MYNLITLSLRREHLTRHYVALVSLRLGHATRGKVRHALLARRDLPREGKAFNEEGGYAMASELDAAKKIAQLPAGMQAKYSNLPRTAQRALIK